MEDAHDFSSGEHAKNAVRYFALLENASNSSRLMPVSRSRDMPLVASFSAHASIKSALVLQRAFLRGLSNTFSMLMVVSTVLERCVSQAVSLFPPSADQ